jgi:hypothetical protein
MAVAATIETGKDLIFRVVIAKFAASCHDQRGIERSDEDRKCIDWNSKFSPRFFQGFPSAAPIFQTISHSVVQPCERKKMRQNGHTFGLRTVLVSATFIRDFPDASRPSDQSTEASESKAHPMRFPANANAPAIPT